MMARLGTLDYTTRDYDSLRAQLIARIQSRFPDFDTSPGSPDVMILEALAEIGDRLGYLENRSVNEAFLATARLRQSVMEHCALINYHLKTAQPARATVRFRLRRAYNDPALFPAGTRIETEDSAVAFETTSSVTIPANAREATVIALEGRSFEESASGLSAIDAPEGQRVILGSVPFIGGSERVLVGTIIWTRVDNFLNSATFSRHYVVELDALDRATIVFGDGVNGERPAAASPILVRYRVGGGTRGRVRRNRLTRLVGSFYTTGGIPIDVEVTNPDDSTTGEDRETLAHARLAAPMALRGTTRTIAREDFEIHAMEVPGVARALCHTRNEDPLIPFLRHVVYIVPGDAGTPSSALVAAVVQQLSVEKPHSSLDDLEVRSAEYKRVSIAAIIVVFQGVDSTAVLFEAIARIHAYFQPTARVQYEERYTLDFGRPVRRAAIIGLLDTIPGVEQVVLSAPATDDALVEPYSTITTKQFPTLSGPPSITVVTRP